AADGESRARARGGGTWWAATAQGLERQRARRLRDTFVFTPLPRGLWELADRPVAGASESRDGPSKSRPPNRHRRARARRTRQRTASTPRYGRIASVRDRRRPPGPTG